MLLADVNVFLGAFSRFDADHDTLRTWLTGRLQGSEPFGVSELVLSAVVRIATNHRVYPRPATPDEAIAFCESVRAADATVIVAPGQRHWRLFAEMVLQTQARANAVPDVYLAALARELGATFVTRDRGFALYAGLRTADPLAE